MTEPLRVGILGAGAVGCFVGGRLAASRSDVVFSARPQTRSELLERGLSLTDLSGPTVDVPPSRFRVGEGTDPLRGAEVILVCVKSSQTAEVAATLADAFADHDAAPVVVSFQNGVRNADVLRAHWGGRVLGAVVGFNVVRVAPGAFRRTTSGSIVLEEGERASRLRAALRAAGFEVEVESELRPVQWAKLVMNVNNAIGALSDVPTRDLLFDRGYRRVMRGVIVEALAAIKAAGIRPARLGPLPVELFPWVLSLPSPVLRVALRAQLEVDPEARSSMWQDLSRGRMTEVDDLNGEIVRLARAHGGDAPMNARIVALVHEAESQRRGSPRLSAEDLWSAITR